jgi:hypothetical protein
VALAAVPGHKRGHVKLALAASVVHVPVKKVDDLGSMVAKIFDDFLEKNIGKIFGKSNRAFSAKYFCAGLTPLCLSSTSVLHFSDCSFWVYQPINRDDWHLLAHAMAFSKISKHHTP